LLASERATTLQARSTKRIAQKKLAETEANFKRLSAQAEKTPQSVSAALIKGQWERAQKDLERAQVVHGREAEQTEAKLAQLHEALEISRQARSGESESQKRQARIQIVTGIAATFVVGATIFGVMHYLHSGKPATSVSETTVASEERAERPQTPSGGSLGPSGFVNGVGRLSVAFTRFPGVDPETIMRAVNKKAAASGTNVCAFAWNDGQPALQFGDGHGGNTSIEGMLTRCAEAVERYR
jgi:hypothetical protein